jgi:16S rRNA (cytosine967-C5)-methyltransferase
MRMTPLPHAAALLETILSGTAPADKQMDSYFRQHRNLGARDRGFVAETVYACLRRRRSLEYTLATEDASAPDLLAAHLLVNQGWSARALEEAGYRGDARALATAVRRPKDEAPFAVRHDLPDWLAERLLAQRGEADAGPLAHALNQPAPVDLRVNTLKATREDVQARLLEEGYESEATPYSPSGLRRHERAPLFQTMAFKSGCFEVQDEGSQLLSFLLEPRRQERIVDFCAGSGGKTLHIGALMANTGTVYAFDVSPKRLEKLRPRLARAGVDTVRTQVIEHERDVRLQRLRGKIDRVLVDAPCSGTGTLRRNPDIKWRKQDLDGLVATQKRILHAAAQLLKPGGRLVYATCSLLREENDDVVQDFVGGNSDFGLLPVQPILERRHIPLTMLEPVLRLDPLHHRTDGFYAAVLERAR